MNLATWKKYHCNAVINDKMKCENCNNDLYFISRTKVFCKTDEEIALFYEQLNNQTLPLKLKINEYLLLYM